MGTEERKMGRNCINRRQMISLVWIFSSPCHATFQGCSSCGHSRGHLQDEKGQSPTAELKPGGRADEEVPELWSEWRRGAEEKWEGKPWRISAELLTSLVAVR